MIHEGQLTSLRPGQTAVVCGLDTVGEMRRRLQDLGLIRGTAVQCLEKSPLGDPTAYRIRGTVIALRKRDAASVRIRQEERP
ncbi:MAG: FeoA family protein [Oscillospiraceae bacterium]|nr:FeoA family protein [Oscillospiraceae bacterium]